MGSLTVAAPDKTHYQFRLESEYCVVMVSSTTGDGEQPEKAENLWRTLQKRARTNCDLSRLNFTILGLGDSNYTRFCNGPKNLRSSLLQVGGKEFHEAGWADDGVGSVSLPVRRPWCSTDWHASIFLSCSLHFRLELTVEPWLESLWPSLAEVLSASSEKREKRASQVIMAAPAAATPPTPTRDGAEVLDVDELISRVKGIRLESESLSDLIAPPPGDVSTPACPAAFLDILYTPGVS